MMKAGVYWVGDLCYVLDAGIDLWDEVCDLFFAGGDGEYELKDGIKFAMASTAYGDGSYFDRQNREYWVDSGTIGCVLLEEVREEKGGNVVEFPREFIIDMSEGVISFIAADNAEVFVAINTDPEDEDDSDY